MANIALSFAAENGISLDDAVGIFTGSTDPGIVGEDAPIGSLFIRQDGSLYQKFGANLTDWIRFSQGLGEAVKISATDVTAGYLNLKLLTSAALTKTIGNAGANETLTLDLANVGTPGTYRSVTTNAKGQVTAGTNPTTLAGYGITDAQPLATNLTSLAGVSTTGFYVRQSAGGTTTTRTIVGTTNQVNVLSGDGISGNPTLSFSTTVLFPGTTGIRPPAGTTAQRVATASYTRYNTDTNRLEYFNGTTWIELVASTGGTVTSIAATQPAAGLTITGGPITTSGTLTFSLANDLAAVEAMSGVGVVVRSGTDAWGTRTLTGTTNRITITNGAGVSGAPTFDIDSAYIGQTSITTLGVIDTGTWQGATLSTAFGGTGRTSIGTANQMLGVNTTSSGLEYKTILNGTGIGLLFTGGQIQINNTGVTSIAGTANQVIVSGVGAVTLSLPQSIATTSAPTFSQITVAADPTSALQVATKQYVDNAVQGVSPKQSALVGTTGNIVLFGTQTIDGVALSAGDRVLVKNQAAAADNGIFVVSTGAWTRAADFDNWVEVPGAFVFVEQGTTQADTGWVSTADQGGTLGTTSITWVQFSSADSIIAGTGLTRAGNTLSITDVGVAGTYNIITTNASGQVIAGSSEPYITANQSITLQGSVIGAGSTLLNTTLSSTGVTAGTYSSVTVTTEGRISAGTNPNTLSGYGITDAQPLNAFLTSNAALSTNGIVVRNGNTALTRAVAAGSSKVSVTDGDGVVGNPTIDVVEANLELDNIGGVLSVSKGGTNLTAVGAANQLLGVNATANALEYKALTGIGITVTHTAQGISLQTLNNGTVTSVAATGSTGLTVSGSPVTGAGTLTFTLGGELQGLAGLSALGLVTRIGTGTYAARSIVSGTGTLSITNPVGTVGNFGLDLTTIGTSGTYRSVTTDVYGRVTSGTNPTTLAGYGITDAASSSGTYITVNQEPSLPNERVLAGTADQISLVDNGASSSIAVGIASNPVIPGTESIKIPAGTTAQRPAVAVAADTRYNSTLESLEYYDGTTWHVAGDQSDLDSISPMGFVDRTQSTISYNAGTRTFTIAPVGASYLYYNAGVKIKVNTPQSVVWPDTNGRKYFYFDATNTLAVSSSFFDLKTMVPVAGVCWDTVNDKVITFADERHGVTMDWATHQYLHVTQGTKFAGGLDLQNFTIVGTGSSNADAQFGLSNGVLYDEDLRVAITHSGTPTASHEQVLTPIARLPVQYRIGTGDTNWTSDNATDYPVKLGTARLQYNLNTAGTWSVVDAAQDEFVAVWVFGSNGFEAPVFSILGQRSDATLAGAKANNTFETASFGQLPSAETKILYRLIYQTNSGYANAVKAKLVDVSDLRTTTALVVSTSTTTTHDSLSGLTADDHTQYVHTSVPRTIVSAHTFNPSTATSPFLLGANAQGQLITGLNADLLDGLNSSAFQLSNANLTALSNTSTTGLYAITGSGTAITRSLVQPAAGLTITNSTGVSGNPTFALANDLAAVESISGTGLVVRTGVDTWNTRTLVAGSGISITNADGTAGNITIAATGGGTVTSVGLALPSIFTVTGSPVTTSGTLTGTLASQAANTVFAAPSGAVGAPSFRLLTLVGNYVNDVAITSPQANQVLAYDSITSKWVNTGAVGSNATGLVGVGQAGAAAWTLISGSTYRADFAHNLGTTNVVITVYDSSTLQVVIPSLVTCTNTNTVRVQVVGNTRTLKVVVVANGQSIVAGGSTPSSVIVAKDGVTVGTTTTRINFTGQAVSVTDGGSLTTNVSIGSRFSYFANSLDTPNNADFAINALAPVTTDPSFASLNVRAFSNTVEQGVACTVSIPPGATTAVFKFRGRAQTAPGVASVVQPRLYHRRLPNNAAVTAWSAAQELANIVIPTNANFQYATQTVALATLGMVADSLYQLEFTRRVAGVTGTNLAANFLLAEVTVEFA